MSIVQTMPESNVLRNVVVSGPWGMQAHKPVEGNTFDEVASLCGFSESTAKRRIKVVNTRLRRLAAELPEFSVLFCNQPEEA